MIYLHYPEAHQAFSMADQPAKTIMAGINAFMISDTMRHSDLRPLCPCDMRYFYHSIVSAIGKHVGRTFHSGLEGCYEVMPMNYPDLKASSWVQYDFVAAGLAETYVEWVRGSGTEAGYNFDVVFACAVACRSIDNKLVAELTTMKERETRGNEFEEWLAGFNE
jgi:hypothetical protein